MIIWTTSHATAYYDVMKDDYGNVHVTCNVHARNIVYEMTYSRYGLSNDSLSDRNISAEHNITEHRCVYCNRKS